jgi:hypothetical protein
MKTAMHARTANDVTQGYAESFARAAVVAGLASG